MKIGFPSPPFLVYDMTPVTAAERREASVIYAKVKGLRGLTVDDPFGADDGFIDDLWTPYEPRAVVQ